jgi:hypothetical protein
MSSTDVTLPTPQREHSPPFAGDIPNTSTKTLEDVVEHADPPSDEGGWRGWLTVFAVFLTSFMAFGVGNVWGIYQDAYTNQPDSRFRDVGTFKLGFVGGCSVGFGFAVGPFSNILTSQFGIHVPIVLGVLLMAVALELASIAREYWQLLLSQGIMFGYVTCYQFKFMYFT